MVRWRRWIKSFDKITIMDQDKLTNSEEKAIKLWKLCLKSEDTQMQYNTYGIRQIEKDDVLIIFKPFSSRDYIMTVMYIKDEKTNLYELHIPEKYANFVCDYFDTEMEKRMRKAENSKRAIIETSIDKLIEYEEKEYLDRTNNKK